MKLRFNGRQVIKHFKSNLIESYTNHIIPTKLVVEIPYDGYTLTLLPSSDCIVGTGLVSWGDGTASDLNKSLIHKYSKAGTYIIEGSFILKPTATDSLKETLVMIEYLSNKQTTLVNCFNSFTKLKSINQKRCYLNATSMAYTFYNCRNLRSKAICGPNVTDMVYTYRECHNLTGSPVCGDKVTVMFQTYYNCQNLTGSPVCGNNVVNMDRTYYLCQNLTGSPVCGPNVIDMSHAYFYCSNLTGSPVCGPNITDMSSTYYNCYNITGSPVCGDNVTNMEYAYFYCSNLTGSPVCGDIVTNMSHTYSECYNLTGNPVCGPNVTDMEATYDSCKNLTGSPVCGDKVTDISHTYYHCENLTGSPVCGDKVTDMYTAYAYCYNLTGSPVCGPNVTDISYAYQSCYNITGSPVCGDKVTAMSSAYRNCHNLTGPAIAGKNVTNMAYTYADSANISRNAYIFSSNITCAWGSFVNKGPNGLNIYVPRNSSTLNKFLYNNSYSIINRSVEWVNDISNARYYNEARGLYIYPVDDVERAYKENELSFMTYESNNTSLAPLQVLGANKGFEIFATDLGNGMYRINACKNNAQDVVNYVQFSQMSELHKIINITDSIDSLANSFRNSRELIEKPICGPNVTNMCDAFYYCYNLTGEPVCGDKVVDMTRAYINCHNLTGSPVCGPNVTNMQGTYLGCKNLTGSPVCGDLVDNLRSTYLDCRNITGEPVCGNLVTTMDGTYMNCYNLTGSPVCGEIVTNMYQAYYNCWNLTGPAIGGPNVVNMSRAYDGCINIAPNGYFFSNNITNVGGCFRNKYNDRMLNLYVHKNSRTLNTCLSTGTSSSLVSNTVSWINDMTNNGCYYNTGYNIYIYPVENVYKAFDDNDVVKPVLKYISYEEEGPGLYINGSEYYGGYTQKTTLLTNGLYETSVFVNNPDIRITRFDFYNLASVTKVTYISNTINSLAGSFVGMGALTNVIPMEFMDNIESMSSAYRLCSWGLEDQPVCGPNVIDMDSAYEDCYHLTGQPVCGDKVIDMALAYSYCHNLTGHPVCGPNVVNMSETYNCCYNLTGQPVCGDKVTNMHYAYGDCHKLTGQPVCGPNVVNMCVTYADCWNLTGQPVCGEHVNNVSSLYYNCRNLTGYPVVGPNVTDMFQMYRNCVNLTGDPVCGDKVYYMEGTYQDCYNLTGPVVIGPNVRNCYWGYANCKNLASNAFIYAINLVNVSAVLANRDKNSAINIFVVNGSNSLNTCLSTSSYGSLTGEYMTWTNDMATNGCHYNTEFNIYIYPVDNVSMVRQRHMEFNNLITEYVSTNNAIRPIIDNGTYTDYNAVVTPTTTNSSLYKISLYRNNDTYNVSRIDFNNNDDLREIHIMSRSITNMSNCFNDCSILKKHPICGPKVTDMSHAFDNCVNLTGNPQCKSKVTNMTYAYYNCRNLTGNAICGEKVVNMDFAYNNCIKLTGEPACGDKVTSMVGAYGNCVNITGKGVCGNSVTNMSWAYHNCVNLTGPILVETNVVNLSHTYENCYNISHNTYICSDKINDMSSAFKNKDNSKITNIFVPAVGYNTTHNTLNTCLCNNTSSIVGNNITWTNDMTTNGCYYNTAYNIYIYPVDNARYTYYSHHAIIAYTASSLVFPSTITSTGGSTITYRLRDPEYEIVIYKNNTNDNVSYLRFTYPSPIRDVYFLTPTITDMSSSFASTGFRGKAICGPNVTNMSNAYLNTVVTEAVCGPNVTDMYQTYENCWYLTEQAVCGDKVVNMSYTYCNCGNLTGSPVCGPNVTNMYYTYWCCGNLTGSPACGPNVTDMGYTYQRCYNLTGSPVCGDKVVKMYETYHHCYHLTGSPACGPNVTDMRYTYRNCYNLTGYPVCGNNVTEMQRTYDNCYNLTGPAIFGPNVINAIYTYDNCHNLSNCAFVLSTNVSNAAGCLYNINKRIDIYVPDNSNTLNTFIRTNRYNTITGFDTTWVNDYATNKCYYNTYYNRYIYPVANVEEMRVLIDRGIISYTTVDNTIRPNIVGANGGYTESVKDDDVSILKNDRNDIISYVGFASTIQASKIQSIKYLTPDITNMSNGFRGANILTGYPVCGENVTNMANTYVNCSNLTGYPVCGPNVVNMSNTYRSCYNITGTAVAGPNVTDMDGTFYDCVNISSEAFVISNKVTSAVQCFYGKDNSRLLNIYVPVNSITLNTFLNTDINTSVTGLAITWSNNSDCYYNTKHNVYIYPVADVQELYYNKLGIITYIASDSKVNPNLITNMNGETVSYVPKKEVIGYNNNYKVTLYKHDTSVGNIGINFFDDQSLIGLVNCTETINSFVFSDCYSLTGEPWCGNNVTTMYNAYGYCNNLTGSPVCGSNVTDMAYTYDNCQNLTGSPVCGDNVTTMHSTYYNCLNLTGSPVCGDKVVDMYGTYFSCQNLTGSPVCGPNVTNMNLTYYHCENLTGSPVIGPNVNDMYCTYIGCQNLTGNPVCGPDVVNMRMAYQGCLSLTGSPVCGDKVRDMYAAYNGCGKLTGSPSCGENVTLMYYTYAHCSNLTGEPVCGPNVTNMNGTYYGCRNITGIPVCGNKVTDMTNCYYQCPNITVGIIGPKVTDAAYAYYGCKQISNLYFFGNSVYNMHNCIANFSNDSMTNIYIHNNTEFINKFTKMSYYLTTITGDFINFTNDFDANRRYYNTAWNIYLYVVDNVYIKYEENESVPGAISLYETTDVNMRPIIDNGFVDYSATIDGNLVSLIKNDLNYVVNSINFSSKGSLTKIRLISKEITNISGAFSSCYNLTGSAICGPTVTDMSHTYQNCINLTTPVCGNDVTNMSYAYQNCYSLTGRAICGPNVTDMSYAYQNCYNITGRPLCGDNVVNMCGAYSNCISLTGRPVCGNNVTDMSYAYYNCYNLTGDLVIGNNVVNIAYAYANCGRLNKPVYIYTNNIVNATGCLYGKNNSVMLDIYLHANSNTCNTFLINNAQSLIGSPITWTNDMTTNGCYYNTAYNIYIYPVDNVIVPVSYNVSNHSGASYGYYYDTTNDFWVSGNKGVNNSAALCNVRIENPVGKNVVFEYICNGESSYDYALFSNVNRTLYTNHVSDTTNVFYNCHGQSSPDLRSINYGPVNGTIQVKYRKDSSAHYGYDTLQFRVKFE